MFLCVCISLFNSLPPPPFFFIPFLLSPFSPSITFLLFSIFSPFFIPHPYCRLTLCFITLLTLLFLYSVFHCLHSSIPPCFLSLHHSVPPPQPLSSTPSLFHLLPMSLCTMQVRRTRLRVMDVKGSSTAWRAGAAVAEAPASDSRTARRRARAWPRSSAASSSAASPAARRTTPGSCASSWPAGTCGTPTPWWRSTRARRR